MSVPREWIGRAAPEALKQRIRRIRNQRKARLYESLDLRWTLKSGITLKLQSDSDWVMFCDIFLDEEYDEPIRRALCAGARQAAVSVLDLGANSGFFTLRTIDRAHYMKFAGTIDVIAVEGSPSNARRFAGNLEAAGLPSGAKVRAVHGLIGERSGAGHILESSFGATSHMDPQGVPVPYVDISLLVQGWPQIDLLKCDIEGSEHEFLRVYPDVLRKTGTAVLELHDAASARTEECRQLLGSYGLTNRQLLRTCQNNTVELFWR
jgi:FkbM family methyltransferase